MALYGYERAFTWLVVIPITCVLIWWPLLQLGRWMLALTGAVD